MSETDIVKALERMCDDENPQDKKMLLLAELVTQKFNGIDRKQKELHSKLEETNDKLDAIAKKFSVIDPKSLGYLTLLSQHPKVVKLIIFLVSCLVLSGAIDGVYNFILRLW